MQKIIKIFSKIEAEEWVKNSDIEWDIISIGSQNDLWPKFEFNSNVCQLDFDDLKFDPNYKYNDKLKKRGFKYPTYKEISKGIMFARMNSSRPLLIHCAAGISRSPAMAFLIIYDELRDEQASYKKLHEIKSPDLIMPNEYIIKLGRELIDNGF